MRTLPDALMLFAAGRGTRMGALTDQLPKPLIEVGGRALIDHALAQIDGAGIGRVVVNLHYRAEQLRAHLADRPEIVFSDETAALLETGGGLRLALPLLGEGPVFTLNTDAVWTGANVLATLRSAWKGSPMAGLLHLVRREDALGHGGPGDFDLDADGRLTRGTAYVYTGTQIIDTRLLAAIPEPAFSLNRVWDLLLAERRLFGTVHSGRWCDVGHPAAIPLAEAMLREGADV